MTGIVDVHGRPLQAAGRARASTTGAGGSGFPGYQYPYQAGAPVSQEMGNWHPAIRSPDSEITPYRDRIVARNRDMSRNDGWAAGGITRILDNTVGTHLRLSAAPDYRALALRTGIKAFDAVWADEYRRAVEALWRGYSEDIQKFNDVSRQLTVGQQFRLAMRHKLIDGDGLGVVYWFPEQVGYGGASYATALQLVDPDRLCNPYQAMDDRYLRGGVEVDDFGAAHAYHLRKAEPNDWYLAEEANTWERIERYDPDGWQRVIHDYDLERAGQHRGVGVFTPILTKMRMLGQLYGWELQAASVAAQFGHYVVSPYDPALVQDALGGDVDDELNYYQQMRADWARDRPALLNGVRIPTLAPGERIDSVQSQHPNANFGAFAQEMLRLYAAAAGTSAEQITQDWSRTNYSSARAAMLESWKTLKRRKNEFCMNFASPFYAVWLQEPMDRGELPLPAGAPAYMEMRTAYARCSWLGVGRGWVDPVKEKQGAQLGMEIGLSTLRDEGAEQGVDWEEQLDQREIEARAFEERGLPMPSWGAPKPGPEDRDDSPVPA